MQNWLYNSPILHMAVKEEGGIGEMVEREIEEEIETGMAGRVPLTPGLPSEDYRGYQGY